MPTPSVELYLERWLPVVGYEGAYEVSDHGRVRSVLYRYLKYTKRTLPTLLIQRSRRYSAVWLYKDGIKKQKYVHLLVADAFMVPRPTPDHEINHKGRNGNCNIVDNLEWLTHSENMSHSYTFPERKRLRGELHPKSKLTAENVLTLRRMKIEGFSHLQLAERFHVSKSLIKDIIARRSWKHI